jgi:protease-4
MNNPATPQSAAEIPSPITTPGGRVAAGTSPYPPIIINPPRSMFSRFFGWLGWMMFLLCALVLYSTLSRFADYFDTTGGITEKYHSGAKLGTDKIAIITLDGPILDGDGFVKKQIDRVRDDDTVRGVVLRIDSPGGTVTGSDFIYHHLKKLRAEKIEKYGSFPMVVSMGGMAASGGYYVAMAVEGQENSIFAEPTTTTGSIGVIIPHYDLTGLMEEYGVKDDSIKTHDRKQMLSMTKKLSEEDRAILQAYIGESFTRFKDIVKDGRPKFQNDEAALDKLATGEVFTASQAKQSGLIDEIGFIEEAIDRVKELGNLDSDSVRVVQFEAPASLFDFPSLIQAPGTHIDLGTLFDLSSPKAYYLATSLPALVKSRN